MVAELIADVLNTSCTASLRSAIFEKVKYIGYPYPEAVKASLVQTYGKVIRGFEPLLASILGKQKFDLLRLEIPNMTDSGGNIIYSFRTHRAAKQEASMLFWVKSSCVLWKLKKMGGMKYTNGPKQ